MADEALMARVAHGDRAAFSILLRRHLDAIHAFNRRLLGNSEDAADVAQETFLRVWRRAGTWRPGRFRRCPNGSARRWRFATIRA